MASKVDDILAEFGERTELGRLTLEDSGSCRFLYDDSIIVEFHGEPDSNRLVLTASLGPPAFGVAQESLQLLLRTNLLWKEMGGAYFGFDGEDLQLLKTIDLAGVDGQQFDDQLVAFLNQAERWRETLDRITTADSTDNSSSEFRPDQMV